MLIKKAYSETPGVPKTLYENLSNFWLMLKINPISVMSFVRSMKGKSPGKTEKTKSFKPEIVPVVYLVGFEMIKKIIAKMSRVKSVSAEDLLKKNLKIFEHLIFLFVVIISYMLKLMC